MDIHVAPAMNVEYLGGDFRRPLPPADDVVIQTMTEGLKKIFEVERSL
jgi:hypothetical protein